MKIADLVHAHVLFELQKRVSGDAQWGQVWQVGQRVRLPMYSHVVRQVRGPIWDQLFGQFAMRPVVKSVSSLVCAQMFERIYNQSSGSARGAWDWPDRRVDNARVHVVWQVWRASCLP